VNRRSGRGRFRFARLRWLRFGWLRFGWLRGSLHDGPPLVRRNRYSLPPTGRNPFTRLGALGAPEPDAAFWIHDALRDHYAAASSSASSSAVRDSSHHPRFSGLADGTSDSCASPRWVIQAAQALCTSSASTPGACRLGGRRTSGRACPRPDPARVRAAPQPGVSGIHRSQRVWACAGLNAGRTPSAGPTATWRARR